MKELSYIPVESKPDPSTRDRIEGRYLIKHPLIARYFIEVFVGVEDNKEIVSAKLVCLVSANKAIFRNVTRYLTWEDCQGLRDMFWYQDEDVLQLQKVNYDEIAKGDYYSHLYCLK